MGTAARTKQNMRKQINKLFPLFFVMNEQGISYAVLDERLYRVVISEDGSPCYFPMVSIEDEIAKRKNMAYAKIKRD